LDVPQNGTTPKPNVTADNHKNFDQSKLMLSTGPSPLRSVSW